MFERMIIQLVDYKPMGQGREMPGIDPLTMVPVRVETPSGWNDQILPAGQIKAGLPVMGLSHIGSTGTGAPFPADPRQQTTWFRVGKTRIFEPPITLTVGLSNAMETDGADDRPGDENGEDKKAGAESGEGGMSQPLRLHLADDLTR